MDLHNNAVGIMIYNNTPRNPQLPYSSHLGNLVDKICIELKSGKLKVFSDPSNNQVPPVYSNDCKCN